MVDKSEESTTPVISNTAYDIFKFVVQIILPGLGALYVSLSGFWGLPEPEAVAGSIAAIALFLGLFLKYSEVRYAKSDAKFDGQVIVNTTDPMKDTFTIDTPVEGLLNDGKKQIILKINRS